MLLKIAFIFTQWISIHFDECILVIGKWLNKLTNYRKRRTNTSAWVWQTNRTVFNDTNYVSFQWRDWPYVSNLGSMCYVVCNHECKYRLYKPNKGHLMSFKFNFLWNKSRVGKVIFHQTEVNGRIPLLND